MMYIYMTFSKKNHSTHSTELFKIFFSLLTLSTAFLQKASGLGKMHVQNTVKQNVLLYVNLLLHVCGIK